MEYKTLDEIRDVAVIQPSWLGSRPLTKCERLERWAEVLGRQGDRRLKTLFEIEYMSRAERAALRANDSPLSSCSSFSRNVSSPRQPLLQRLWRSTPIR